VRKLSCFASLAIVALVLSRVVVAGEDQARTRSPEDSSAESLAAKLEGGPFILLSFQPHLSELEIIEAIVRSRTRRGLDRLPNCYYGPARLGNPLGEVNVFFHENPSLSGEEYWRWIDSHPRDPHGGLVVLVRSGTLPDCAAGDLDERLRKRRSELIKEPTEP